MEPIPITLQLTIDDARNLVAFGNRATMKGSEADLWVGLKMKVLQQVEAQNKTPDQETEN